MISYGFPRHLNPSPIGFCFLENPRDDTNDFCNDPRNDPTPLHETVKRNANQKVRKNLRPSKQGLLLLSLLYWFYFVAGGRHLGRKGKHSKSTARLSIYFIRTVDRWWGCLPFVLLFASYSMFRVVRLFVTGGKREPCHAKINSGFKRKKALAKARLSSGSLQTTWSKQAARLWWRLPKLL